LTFVGRLWYNTIMVVVQLVGVLAVPFVGLAVTLGVFVMLASSSLGRCVGCASSSRGLCLRPGSVLSPAGVAALPGAGAVLFFAVVFDAPAASFPVGFCPAAPWFDWVHRDFSSAVGGIEADWDLWEDSPGPSPLVVPFWRLPSGLCVVASAPVSVVPAGVTS